MSSQPIGIFDSGIGGLTVAKALVDLLPNENLIYFGDTAHLPYGDKSTAAIQEYAVKITQMLLDSECKLILMACNSASAAAFNLIIEYVAGKAQVVNVIDPVVAFLRDNYTEKRVGLIGTRQTVSSHVYDEKIVALQIGIDFYAKATPLLAPAIEDGFAESKVIDELLKVYLDDAILRASDALILGCTHYPLIKTKVAQFYDNKITVLDSSKVVAENVRQVLANQKLLNTEAGGKKHFLVSDYTDSFAANTQIFFQEKISLERYPLWD
ncbi:MAG: glutamate racemase [Gammaproteobacteria bacterium]|nr:glutamate racemase [Gammaproteobacteria bacterium]